MADNQRLVERQQRRRAIVLHRAIAASHQRAQRAHTASLAVSALAASLGVVARIVPEAAPTVAVVGAVWVVVYAVGVAPWAARHQRTSATLQEMLAEELFDLPWNQVAVGDRLTEDEVSELSRQYRGDEKRFRTYYLLADVPPPYDVSFCLEQDLKWGSRVRRRYARLLLALAVLWSLAGITVGIAAQLSITELMSNWFVPSLGLLLVCLDNYRSQITNTRERTRVHALVTEHAKEPLVPGPEWTDFARQVQDLLFQMRRQQPRTPMWFFLRYHDQDEADFRYRKEQLEERLTTASPAPPG